MADFTLIVDVDYGVSYEKMRVTIDKIVTELNSKPQKIKVEFDEASVKTMRGQLDDLRNVIKAIGKVPINAASLGEVSKRAVEATSSVQKMNKAISSTAAAAKAAAEAERQLKKIADAAAQARALLNKNMEASGSDSYQKLNAELTKLESVLEACGGDSSKLNSELKAAGVNGATAVNRLYTAISTLKQELQATGSEGTVSLRQITETYTRMQTMLNANQSMIGTEQFTALSAQASTFLGIIEACGNDASLLETTLHSVGLNGADAIESAKMAMASFKAAIAEAATEEERQAAAAKAAAEAERQAESVRRSGESAIRAFSSNVVQAEKSLLNWSAAENSRNQSSREAYRALQDSVNAAKAARAAYDGSEGSVNRLKDANMSLGVQLKATEQVLRANGDATKSLSDRLGGLAQKFTAWLSVSQVIMFAVRSVRQMIKASVELDSAMTQMQIVTKASSSEMQAFGDTAADVAKRTASAITDVVDSATTFARLGYTMDESAKLAEFTAMLQNVGDIDVSDAQDAITSIVKAFDIDASQIESIMDKLVETGNHFPISVAQIAEGMNNASSSLAAAGNSFEQSVALLTAANTTVQDAAKASTGLRTIAARIRNTKTELDELGEVMTTANYEELIKTLTDCGVALTDINGEYRTTYDIMKDIAAKWDEMDSMRQAALATALSGTRQQAIFYSIVEQFQEASGAMDAMANSAGALSTAYDTYLNSVQAHINQFKTAFKELSASILSSGLLKFIVDFGSALLNILTALQKVHLLLPTIIASIVLIKGIQISKLMSASAAKVATLSASLIANKAATDSLAASVASLTIQEKQRLITEIQAAVTSGALTAEESAQILTTLGLTTAEGALTAANTTLAASFKSLMASIPVFGWIALGISVVIEAVTFLSSSIHDTSDSIHDVEKQLQELDATTKQISDDFRALKSSADEIIPRFAELSKGVDKFGNNISLTDEEYKEFVSLNNRIAEMFPQLNIGMDDNGMAMLNLSYTADTLTDSLWELVKAERALANEKLANQLPEQIDTINKQIDNYNEVIKRYKDKIGYYDMAFGYFKPGNDVANANAGELLKQVFDESTWNNLLAKYTKEIKYESGFSETVVDWDALFGSQEVQNVLQNIELQIEAYQDKIAKSWSSLTPSLIAVLQTDQTYSELDELSQRIATALVNGIDVGELLKSGFDLSPDSIRQYITSNIVNPLYSASPEIKEAFSTLLDLSDDVRSGEITADEFASNIQNTFSNLFDTLDDDGKATLISWLNALGIAGASADDIIKNIIDAFGASKQEVVGNGSGSKLDFDKLTDDVKRIKDAYALIETASKEMEDGGLSADTIKALSEASENYLDYLYEENGVIKLNTEAWREYILMKLSDNINGLKETRDALLAEREEIQKNRDALQYRWEHGGASNSLYEQIKAEDEKLAENTRMLAENGIQLGVYTNQYNQAANAVGDFVDAYTEALGNFPSIKDSIENISSAFETLADIQSTVADGFTLTLEKALEFASVYPEILDNATVAADGQITLNEGVVNSFIASKQSELAAQVESEIQQLNAEKAVLTGRVASAQAQIELAKGVAEGKAAMTKEEAQYENDVDNALTQAFIDNGIEEATANQLANAAMAENEEEFARVAMGAFQNMDENSAKAAYDMARNIYLNAKNSALSIADIAKQAHETARAIAAMGRGEVAGTSGLVFSGSGGTYGSLSGMNLYDGSFSGSNYTYQGNTISIDDYISALELDISSYNNAIAQIDGQIAALQAMLQVGVDRLNNGGSGSGSNGSSSGGSGSGSSKSDVDNWFERQYKLHNHLLKMEAEDVEDYLVWLNDAYKRAYDEGLITLYDYYSYQEEVFSKLRDLFRDYLNDVEHEISMRSMYEGETAKILALYKELIASVEKEIAAARAAGLDDTDDYIQELQDKWKSYSEAIKEIEDNATDDAKDAVDTLVQYRIKMLKQEIDSEKDALKAKLDNLKEFYDKQKEMLQDAYNEEKYLSEQAEKRKSVTDIQAELSQLEFDDSSWAQKRKAQLQQQLAEAQQELDEFEQQHALEEALDLLDDAYNAQEQAINAEMDALEQKLNDPEALFNQALADIREDTGKLYEEMLEYNRRFGTGNDEDISDMWEAAYRALLQYHELNGEWYNGIELTNSTGYTPSGDSWDTSPVSGTNPDNQPSTPGTPSSEQSGDSNQSSTQPASTPTLTDSIKKHVAAAIWNGNYGWGNGSTRENRLNEVFGSGNGIQSIVNKGYNYIAGISPSGYSYAAMRKQFKGYYTGTRKAAPGMHAVDELGPEYVFTSSDGSRYRIFSGGEKVLSAKATDFLYRFANSGKEILEKFTRGLFDGGSIGKIQPVVNSNEINMGDIIVRGNADRATVSEIRRAQRESVENMLREFNRLNK